MQIRSLKLIFIKNMLLFIFFGIILSAITTYINYNMKYQEIKQQVSKDSLKTSNRIKSQIKIYLGQIDDSIDAIKTNDLFIDYLTNPTNNKKNIAKQLFLNSMKNNLNFFQLRYIDKNGFEKIRIDRVRDSKEIFFVDEDKLQNKSNRYYFKESVKHKSKWCWHSKFDLNIENSKIEIPIRPTYRVSLNVYHNDKFYGILIVNADMQNLLNYIRKNSQFNTYLIDKDGHYILNPKEENNWSRYLNPNVTLFTEFPSVTHNDFKENKFIENGFLYPLEEFFKNNENIKLGLLLKDDYIDNALKDTVTFTITLGVLILLTSIPIGILISIPTSQLYIKLKKLYMQNHRYLDTIDKYVATITVDLDKKITDASEAFCKINGYTKEELIGKEPSVLKSGNMDKSVYADLWSTITKGLIWKGELENRAKDGKLYWLSMTILPNMTADNSVQSYTSISEDITDKKIIEKISQTDKLTQTYNRVKLDECLENEFDRYLRNKHPFSIILIDIDHFKSVNDKYGHQVGDKVLIEISGVLKEHTRKTDVVGRWGGEEFMIICIDTELQGANELAENLRKRVEEFDFGVVKHKTISIGVSEVKDGDNIETLIKRVDDNLYKAKESGRNNVVFDKINN